MDKETDGKKGGRKLATQLQPTPVLYGRDAIEVLRQIDRKPTLEQKRKAKERRELFAQIQKKGL